MVIYTRYVINYLSKARQRSTTKPIHLSKRAEKERNGNVINKDLILIMVRITKGGDEDTYQQFINYSN